MSLSEKILSFGVAIGFSFFCGAPIALSQNAVTYPPTSHFDWSSAPSDPIAFGTKGVIEDESLFHTRNMRRNGDGSLTITLISGDWSIELSIPKDRYQKNEFGQYYLRPGIFENAKMDHSSTSPGLKVKYGVGNECKSKDFDGRFQINQIDFHPVKLWLRSIEFSFAQTCGATSLSSSPKLTGNVRYRILPMFMNAFSAKERPNGTVTSLWPRIVPSAVADGDNNAFNSHYEPEAVGFSVETYDKQLQLQITSPLGTTFAPKTTYKLTNKDRSSETGSIWLKEWRSNQSTAFSPCQDGSGTFLVEKMDQIDVGGGYARVKCDGIQGKLDYQCNDVGMKDEIKGMRFYVNNCDASR